MGSDLSIGVLYFGSSGAGVKFTELLRDELSKDDKKIVIMARKKELLRGNHSEDLLVEIPKLRVLAALGVGRNKAQKQIFNKIKRDNIRTIIIPMAHPWDLSFQELLQAEGVKIIRIIHDAKRHPGDIWPRTRDIERMCDADFVVTLSQFVASILKVQKRKLLVSCHPELKYGNQITPSNHQELARDYDLIIGRHKKYQNTRMVAKWWTSLPEQLKQGRKLVVAGRVGYTTKVSLSTQNNLLVHNKWLSDFEFGKLVAGANRVICIYREASQSGIVSAAQSSQTPVLVSNVGGLPEQIESSGGGLVTKLESKDDWQIKYAELNNLTNQSTVYETPTRRFMNDVETAITRIEKKKIED
jgi:hypothetical protein